MSNKVQVLITCDVDPSEEIPEAEKLKSFRKLSVLFRDMNIRATYFFVANTAKLYTNDVWQIHQDGHEIGSHGLTHGIEEEYTTMKEHEQRRYLREATEKLQKFSGRPVRSFRGPRVKTSQLTQSILCELNYLVDASVCSQRIDFISSNFINPGWIFAPRLPYQPHADDAFKRGAQPIWVVPVSALIVPFISSTLYMLGVGFMKRFFDLLLSESRRTGKPIVYLMHPVEFASQTKKVKEKATWQSVKARGFYFRRKLKLRIDEHKRFEFNRALFEYIAAHPDIEFTTMSSYVLSPEFKQSDHYKSINSKRVEI
ncbi:polysaccharide deacetylase family protein [candidate division KSB1 bacterium]|nr:polysaccharide deacetylase family protein [candidate division KSB1 bacterium]